jgi:signal transduction histidine kinase
MRRQAAAMCGNAHGRAAAFRLSAQAGRQRPRPYVDVTPSHGGFQAGTHVARMANNSRHRESVQPAIEETIMRTLLSFILLAATLAFTTGARASAEHGTADEAVAMVQKVIAHIKANGKEKTLAEVNNLNGQFRDRDLYVTINDLNMKSLAHGANARMQGKDLIDLKDADGKPFMRERLELVKAKGKGWQDYRFVNPVTKQIEHKSMYFERYEDLVINCGIYKN